MQTVRIQVKKSRCRFLSWYPFEVVDEVTSTFVENYKFSPKYISGDWDGKIHFLSRVSNSFAVGLLPTVVENLRMQDLDTELELDESFLDDYPEHIRDSWEKGFKMPERIGDIVFRDYQLEAGNAFLTPNSVLPYMGILKMPTASGKTFTSAGIASVLNLNTLFVVHGKALVEQAFKVYSMVLPKHLMGKITSNDFNTNQFTVASSDTLAARLKDKNEEVQDYLRTVQFVIADEVHRSTSTGFASVLRYIPAAFRMGLSGTPLKKANDRDLTLNALVGPVIYDLPIERLQEEGSVSEAELTCVYINSPRIDSLKYPDAFKSLIVNNVDRTNLAAKMAIDRAMEDKTVLMLAGNSVKLAEALYDTIKRFSKNSGIKCKHVNGTTSISKVTKAFEDLKDKKIDILITTLLADEGVDIPAINCLFALGSGKSFVKSIQRMGRGLRKKGEGEILEAIDFFDNTSHYFKAHYRQRLSNYNEEKIFRKISFVNDYEVQLQRYVPWEDVRKLLNHAGA